MEILSDLLVAGTKEVSEGCVVMGGGIEDFLKINIFTTLSTYRSSSRRPWIGRHDF